MDLLLQAKGPQAVHGLSTAGTTGRDQVSAAEAPWRCRFDGWVNAAGDCRCNYRGNPNRRERAGRHPCIQGRQQAALPTGTPFKLWDWICNACFDKSEVLYGNHASRDACNNCGMRRAWIEQGHEVKLRLDYPPDTIFYSDW